MKKKVYMLTIGQSPRNDVAPIVEKILGSEFDLVQAGALDELTYKEVQEQLAPKDGVGNEYTLVSRMRDGRAVQMDRSKVEPLIQKKINEAENKGYSLIWLLCTGEFNNLKTANSVFLEPDKIIPQVVKLVIADKRLGVVVPLPEQIKEMDSKFHKAGLNPVYIDASPYTGTTEHFAAVGQALKSKVDYILMDCMGYNEKWQRIVAENSGKPTILSNALMAKVTSEFV
ncbi:AroM family protein [Liquorilactobacillus mali]|uniref:AroM family protein n=1 Tax=Liquorilactobacillus mali TaxID=1618 RepID=UPI0026567F88|nr:AroM family protein [Liquorilactobacillus mali]MDN7145538.1 AroM family protein [Liquorilactobacillus mali]